MKWCKKCENMLDVDSFYKNKRSKDGLDYMCIECDIEYKNQKRECKFCSKILNNNGAARHETSCFFAKDGHPIKVGVFNMIYYYVLNDLDKQDETIGKYVNKAFSQYKYERERFLKDAKRIEKTTPEIFLKIKEHLSKQP